VVVLTIPQEDGTFITQNTTLANTAGSLDCINEDQSKCTLDNIQMVEGDDGNFGSDLSLPSNLNIDTTGIT